MGGQPRAWTDELIACWSAELIRADWGQALVFADCLASQWTEAVLLKAWLLQLIWAPYAPEVKLVSANIKRGRGASFGGIGVAARPL